MLKDIDIRCPLIEKIQKQNEGKDYRIIPEMTVCDGLARVDIAVANGELLGYEIKSDADTLDRLPLQRECYDKTFDKIYIIIGEKHKEQIFDIVPECWGVVLASSCTKGKVAFKELRRAKCNRKIEAQALLELLWRSEVKGLLAQEEFVGLSNKNRRVLRKMAVKGIPLKKIQNYTRESLKNRLGWRDS